MIKAGAQVTVSMWGTLNGNPPILELLPKPGEIGTVIREASISRFNDDGMGESYGWSFYFWIVDFPGYGELEVNREEMIEVDDLALPLRPAGLA